MAKNDKKVVIIYEAKEFIYTRNTPNPVEDMVRFLNEEKVKDYKILDTPGSADEHIKIIYKK